MAATRELNGIELASQRRRGQRLFQRELAIRGLHFCLLLASLACGGEGRAETTAFPEFSVESAREYLQAVAAAVPIQGADRAELDFIRARLESSLGAQDKAEQLARDALIRDPNRADIQLFLADLCIRQDRFDDALTCLHEAVRLNPKIEGGHRRLGMVLDQLGDREGARKALLNALEVAAGDASARLLLGRLLLAQGKPAEAAAQLKQACDLDPKSANAFYALSQAQAKMGDREASQTTFQTFQQLKRQEKSKLDAENAARDNHREMRALAAGFHTQVATFFLNRQRMKPAETHLRQAVRIAPLEVLSYETLATFYLRTGQLTEARRVCEELVRLRPDDATYRVNLGTLLLQLKDYPVAVEHLKRTLELDAKQTQALHNLARFYLGARQDSAEALELCRRLVELQPTAANYDLLAWACYVNGQFAEARSASAQSIEKEPGNATYRERYRRLQQTP